MPGCLAGHCTLFSWLLPRPGSLPGAGPCPVPPVRGSISSSNSAGPCPVPPILDPFSSSRNAGGWSGGEYPHAPLPPALHNLVLVTPAGAARCEILLPKCVGDHANFVSGKAGGTPVPCPSPLARRGAGCGGLLFGHISHPLLPNGSITLCRVTPALYYHPIAP